MSAVVIPSLGAPCLDACLQAVSELDPAPQRVVVVLSGTAPPRRAASSVELVHVTQRLGFAAAANLGLQQLLQRHSSVALLNDDAMPSPRWLGRLERALELSPDLAAVQGSLLDGAGTRVDGRGIRLDHWALPVQVDRDQCHEPEPPGPTPLLAVSGTAAMYRSQALRAVALPDGQLFDGGFGSYHEDLDLGLRLRRAGWQAAWVSGATCTHLGSVSGSSLRWRHPWWILANRWRALAANLTPLALLEALPRLLRGELRAVRTLHRSNPRSALVALAVAAALPVIVVKAWRRSSCGPRISSLAELGP